MLTTSQQLDMYAFVNKARILFSIDRHELQTAGVIGKSDIDIWARFQSDPIRWLLCADDEKSEKVWAIVEKRSRPNIQSADL